MNALHRLPTEAVYCIAMHAVDRSVMEAVDCIAMHGFDRPPMEAVDYNMRRQCMCGSEQDQSPAKGGRKRAMWRSGRLCGVGDFPDFLG